MEENGDKFELKDNTKTYKITLKKLISIILIIVIVVSIIAYCIFKFYYEKEFKNDFNDRSVELGEVLDRLENRTSQERTEDDFEENVNYDYSDFLNSSSEDRSTWEEDYTDLASYDEYNAEDEYKYNAEYAVQFIYSLRTNPLHVIANDYLGYTILRNSEKQADGSYNVKIKFEELSEMVYYKGLYPSCLKSNEDLKNNINVLSEDQINVKDTGIDYDYFATALSFDKIEDNKYKGYFSIEEFNEDYTHDSTKYAEVTAEFNKNFLVTKIECKDVSKESIPEELIYNYSDYTEDGGYNSNDYQYSDYISQ